MSEDAKKSEDDRGLQCQRCGCRHFHVIYTRRASGEKLVRRRECRHCGTRVTTCERIVG
jgi:transcriptional regulator NrdR family protein